MSGKVRVIFLSLAVLAFVAGSFFFGTKMNNSASAQATKPRQRTAVVVLGPTGNDKATGTALVTISDQNQTAANVQLVVRMEISGMPMAFAFTNFFVSDASIVVLASFKGIILNKVISISRP